MMLSVDWKGYLVKIQWCNPLSSYRLTKILYSHKTRDPCYSGSLAEAIDKITIMFHNWIAKCLAETSVPSSFDVDFSYAYHVLDMAMIETFHDPLYILWRDLWI